MEFRKGAESEFEANINVIPLVDIMLVLLIIFMITAPVLKHSFDVNLPETQSAHPQTHSEQNTTTVAITEKREIKVNGLIIRNLEELERVFGSIKDKENLIIEADKRVEYGLVVHVMDIAKKSGFNKIGLITEAKKRR